MPLIDDGWLRPAAAEHRRPNAAATARSRVWVPFAALLAALFIVSIFGAAVFGVVAASDPSFDSTDDLPVGATLALTFFQDLVFVFAAWIAVKLALGHDAARATSGSSASAAACERLAGRRPSTSASGSSRSCCRRSSASPTTRRS